MKRIGWIGGAALAILVSGVGLWSLVVPHGLISGRLPPLQPDLTRDLTEELPFMVGNKTYRSYYLGTDDISDGIRRRYRTWPFDLPSAAACLDTPLAAGEAPQSQRLAWDKLLTPEAIEVCLARVLNRFDSAVPAMEWVAAQGLHANGESRFEDLPERGTTYFFDWWPDLQGGPHPWWNALTQAQLDVWIGMTVTIDVCDFVENCGQLLDRSRSRAFFMARVQTVSKYWE